jgi:hypothetical protein
MQDIDRAAQLLRLESADRALNLRKKKKKKKKKKTLKDFSKKPLSLFQEGVMSGEFSDRYQSDHIGVVQTEEIHRPEPPHTSTSTPKIEALSAESLSSILQTHGLASSISYISR